MLKLLLRHKHGFGILCIKPIINHIMMCQPYFECRSSVWPKLAGKGFVDCWPFRQRRQVFWLRFVGKSLTNRLLRSSIKILEKLKQMLIYIFLSKWRVLLNFLWYLAETFSLRVYYPFQLDYSIFFYYKFWLPTRVFQQYFINAFCHHNLAQMC